MKKKDNLIVRNSSNISSKSCLNLYQMGKLMREEKEKKRLLALKEREEKIMKECSFKPNIQTLN